MVDSSIDRVVSVQIETMQAFVGTRLGALIPTDIVWRIILLSRRSRTLAIVNHSGCIAFFRVNGGRQHCIAGDGVRIIFCFASDVIGFSCGTKRRVNTTKVLHICHDGRGMILRSAHMHLRRYH